MDLLGMQKLMLQNERLDTESISIRPNYVERTKAQQIEDNEKRYTCINSKHKRHILRGNVFQLDCAHRICENCIRILIQEGRNTNCPGNSNECAKVDLTNSDHMFQDKGAERELEGLTIYCPYNLEGCQEKFSWLEVEGHLEICRFRERTCRNKHHGCQVVVHSEDDLKEHEDNCIHRIQLINEDKLKKLNNSSILKRTKNILLLGKTGCGKSSTGNAILGRQEFIVSGKSSNLITPHKAANGVIDGRAIKVVDTPGIVDSTCVHYHGVLREIIQAVLNSPDGFDALIFVIRYPTRITAEDLKSLQIIINLFGEDFFKYAILVITGGDTYRNEMRNANMQPNFKNYIQNAKYSQIPDIVGGLLRRKISYVFFNNFEHRETFKSKQLNILLRNIESIQKKMNHRYKTSFNFRLPVQRPLVVQQPNAIWTNMSHYHQAFPNLPSKHMYANGQRLFWGNEQRIVNLSGVQILFNGIITTIYGYGVQIRGRNSYFSNPYYNYLNELPIGG